MRGLPWRLPPLWLWLFLAGPIIWYTHFWLVYLVAEAACAADDFQVVGISGVSLVTVSATVVAVVAIAWLTVLAYRSWANPRERTEHEQRPLLLAGWLMGAFFVVATLFVGVPALLMSPCG